MIASLELASTDPSPLAPYRYDDPSFAHVKQSAAAAEVDTRTVLQQLSAAGKAMIYLHRENLTAVQCSTLIMLATQKTVLMTHVAQQLSMSAAAITGLCDKLEGMGLIARSSIKADRRANVLSITSAGKEVLSSFLALLAVR